MVLLGDEAEDGAGLANELERAAIKASHHWIAPATSLACNIPHTQALSSSNIATCALTMNHVSVR